MDMHLIIEIVYIYTSALECNKNSIYRHDFVTLSIVFEIVSTPKEPLYTACNCSHSHIIAIAHVCVQLLF